MTKKTTQETVKLVFVSFIILYVVLSACLFAYSLLLKFIVSSFFLLGATNIASAPRRRRRGCAI